MPLPAVVLVAGLIGTVAAPLAAAIVTAFKKPKASKVKNQRQKPKKTPKPERNPANGGACVSYGAQWKSSAAAPEPSPSGLCAA